MKGKLFFLSCKVDTENMGAIRRITADIVDIVATGVNIITCGLIGRRRAGAYRARRMGRRPVL